ncbi:MAG: hypothetical protein ACXW1W_04785 [Methylococcaceae bacterium]
MYGANIPINLAQLMLFICCYVINFIFEVSEPIMSPALKGNFNPSFHFLGLIQKAIADGVTRLCVHPACPEVYLVPSEQTFYTAETDIAALEALCLAAPFDLSVELIPDWRPNSDRDVQAGRVLMQRKNPAANNELEARPLQELLWYSALCASKGQLLQGHHAETPVRLTSCPDFSQLFHKEYHPLLAALWFEESMALTALAETTGIPLSQVFDFYNACAALDLIVVEHANVFDPANYLLGLIQKADADRQMWRCELPGKAFLLLAPVEGKFYSEADSAGIAKLCSTPLSELQVSIVDNSGGEEEIVQIGRTRVRRKKEVTLPKLPEHPLSELRFRAALYASHGRLLSGYNINTPVRLKTWPDKKLLKDAASIKEERYIFALAAFMTAKAADLPGIASATNLSLAQVIDFHNACAVVELLE